MHGVALLLGSLRSHRVVPGIGFVDLRPEVDDPLAVRSRSRRLRALGLAAALVASVSVSTVVVADPFDDAGDLPPAAASPWRDRIAGAGMTSMFLGG